MGLSPCPIDQYKNYVKLQLKKYFIPLSGFFAKLLLLKGALGFGPV
jgi:hypothetical protein